MRITGNQFIAGYPAIAVRNFLWNHECFWMTAEDAQTSLSLSPQDAIAFLNKLVDLGLIEESEKRNGSMFFDLTNCGMRLAHASAAKPIHRKTANRLLNEFMERVHTVNATSEYLFQVNEVVLFGSMLSDVDRLGDVDVAIDLQPKVCHLSAEFNAWSMERRDVAKTSGRSFHTNAGWALWPRNEVYKQLKAKSHSLSIHDMDELRHFPNLRYQVLLGAPEKIAVFLENGQVV